MTASWTTDAPGGFTDAEVELLAGIMPPLTLAILLQTTHRDTRTLLTTYLGRHAADRVLAGNIVRGRAEPIRAVVWFSDLVGFTRISDNMSAGNVLALLNDYAQVQIEAIEAHAGHVLKFIGDGLLAIFPDDDTTKACARALDAAIEMRKRIAALNVKRAAAGLPVTDTHLALHVGELLYGNLGGPRRLDFTVLGSAVNEAARIEALCASLDQKVIVSWAFHEAAGDARARLVSLGRYAMKGIARPQELFTLDPGLTRRLRRAPAHSDEPQVARPAPRTRHGRPPSSHGDDEAAVSQTPFYSLRLRFVTLVALMLVPSLALVWYTQADERKAEIANVNERRDAAHPDRHQQPGGADRGRASAAHGICPAAAAPHEGRGRVQCVSGGDAEGVPAVL